MTEWMLQRGGAEFNLAGQGDRSTGLPGFRPHGEGGWAAPHDHGIHVGSSITVEGDTLRIETWLLGFPGGLPKLPSRDCCTRMTGVTWAIWTAPPSLLSVPV